MSLFIRRIVFLVLAVVLPLHGWSAVRVADCAMAIKADRPAHCCGEVKHSQQADATKSTSETSSLSAECLAGANCHCSALYQPAMPFVLNDSNNSVNAEFTAPQNLIIAISWPPLWRPPITV